jgi:hypothetical protein
LRAEDVGAEGKSSPSSLKGSRGAREAASIIWRSSLGRVVGAYGASASGDTQAVPHRTGSAAAPETALKREAGHTSGPSPRRDSRNRLRSIRRRSHASRCARLSQPRRRAPDGAAGCFDLPH